MRNRDTEGMMGNVKESVEAGKRGSPVPTLGGLCMDRAKLQWKSKEQFGFWALGVESDLLSGNGLGFHAHSLQAELMHV